MTSSLVLRTSVVSLLVAAFALLAFSVAFAQEPVSSCAVRADLTAQEVQDITGTSRGAVTQNSLPLTGDQAGENALLCTYSLIKFITNLGVAVIVIVSIAVFLYAAFLYLTAGSGENQGKARSMLIWGVVGLVVAFLANNIPNIVRGFLGS